MFKFIKRIIDVIRNPPDSNWHIERQAKPSKTHPLGGFWKKNQKNNYGLAIGKAPESRLKVKRALTGTQELRREKMPNQVGEHVSKYVKWLPKSEAEALEDFLKCLQDKQCDSRINYYFAIVSHSDMEVIGSVGITLDGNDDGEIGWFLRKDFWGCGYGKEAAMLMVEYGFKELSLKSIAATCHPENIASQGVMKYCGLKVIKQSKDQIAFSLSRNDWKKSF